MNEIKLDEIYEFSSGLSKPASEFGFGYPFLGFKDVFYNSAIPKELNEQVNSNKKEIERCSIKRGDVFLTRTSETQNELGMSCVALEDLPNATFNGFTKRLRPKKENIVIPEYARYFFRSKFFRRQINSYSSLSTRASLNNEMLSNFKIILHPKKYQEAIGSILQKLDHKIELNQKMNETLEEIAKTLFKSWFIDFDPVRAKAEGRSTGLSKEISDLFPDSFQDSELGEIPKGWSKRVITDIADKISDKYKKDEDWSNEKLIDLSRMPSNSISLNSYGRGEELSTSVCKFKKYDFLFGSIRPYFYKAGICPYDGVSNTSVFILRAKKIYDKEFMYCYSSSDFTFEKSIQYSDGTKMPIIKWKDFKEFPFALPNEELRKQFSSIINPIVDKIILNIDEQEVLSKLRDLLLPKLISGELKITDAESLVEEVGI